MKYECDMTQSFTSIFWKEGSKHVGLCLELNVSSFGDTEAQAHSNLKEAIEVTLEDLLEEKNPAPLAQIKKPKIEQLEVTV